MGRALTACLCHGERSRGDLGYSSSLQYLESRGYSPDTSGPWSQLCPGLCFNTTALTQLESAVPAGEPSSRIKWNEENQTRLLGWKHCWERETVWGSPAQLPEGTLHSGPVARKGIWAERPKLKHRSAERERTEIITIAGWEATETCLYDCADNIKLRA